MLSIIPLPKKAKENAGIYVLPKKVKAYSEIELPLLNDRVEMCEIRCEINFVEDFSAANPYLYSEKSYLGQCLCLFF